MSGDLQAVWLTALLAATTTLLLVPLASPLAWWLARSTSPSRSVIEAVVAMPLVLPPTVLGGRCGCARAPLLQPELPPRRLSVRPQTG